MLGWRDVVRVGRGGKLRIKMLLEEKEKEVGKKALKWGGWLEEEAREPSARQTRVVFALSLLWKKVGIRTEELVEALFIVNTTHPVPKNNPSPMPITSVFFCRQNTTSN